MSDENANDSLVSDSAEPSESDVENVGYVKGSGSSDVMSDDGKGNVSGS